MKMQVTLKSQVEAIVTIVDAKLALQPGFSHVDDPEGRPSPSLLLPLSLSATREGALLFVVRSDLAARKEGNMLFPVRKHITPKNEVLHVTLLNRSDLLWRNCLSKCLRLSDFWLVILP
jgi:hypothetical protein